MLRDHTYRGARDTLLDVSDQLAGEFVGGAVREVRPPAGVAPTRTHDNVKPGEPRDPAQLVAAALRVSRRDIDHRSPAEALKPFQLLRHHLRVVKEHRLGV